ncbi:hypothetical protein COCNU_12G000710 [Cocos nucifera]|uniref:Uncharacterized protein n=1 Tax=Cocos nucifera TaxID=13894 RepID=A0A8K0IR46_COCNU|nr:hypothetical protein COCNU_12G000710 [Cocos nucifera]
MHRKYGEDPTIQPYFDVDSWVEAIEPCKKDRVFGLSQHTFVSSSPSSINVSSTVTSNQKRPPDDPLVQEMCVLKNDMQKMSNSLEMIQQILQAMTTPHSSSAPSSSTSKHPESLERNPTIVSPPVPQSAPRNWSGTWWTALFSWIHPPMNTQRIPMAAPSSAP